MNKQPPDYPSFQKAYSESNLNRITSKLIDAYKSKNTAFLQKIASLVRQYSVIGNADTSRLFTSLIQLYHPDRHRMIMNHIETCFRLDQTEKLNQYTHIFKTLDFLDAAGNLRKISEDIDYTFEFEYGLDHSDFDDLTVDGHLFNSDSSEASNRAQADFIHIMSEREGREFGFEIPLQSLEYLTGELNLSDCGLVDLIGIENCFNISILNLSQNNLINIMPLGFLHSLEELYLSENRVDAVDGLTTLTNLKILDLSFNEISDIRFLLNLPALEYLNLIGNPVNYEHIQEFRQRGVIVLI